jgi:hypothetical protein
MEIIDNNNILYIDLTDKYINTQICTNMSLFGDDEFVLTHFFYNNNYYNIIKYKEITDGFIITLDTVLTNIHNTIYTYKIPKGLTFYKANPNDYKKIQEKILMELSEKSIIDDLFSDNE